MIIKRVISITIIFCLMLSVCIFAHADIDETIIYEFEEIQPEEISNFTTMLDGGGDNPVTPNVIYNGIKLFEFSAVNVSESVFSDLTNKYFYKSDLTNGKLVILARLENTDSSVSNIKVGACYRNPATGVMIPEVYDYYTNGTLGTRMWDASEFDSGVKYYGYAKNESGRGTISGKVTLYNASGAVVN